MGVAKPVGGRNAIEGLPMTALIVISPCRIATSLAQVGIGGWNDRCLVSVFAESTVPPLISMSWVARGEVADARISPELRGARLIFRKPRDKEELDEDIELGEVAF